MCSLARSYYRGNRTQKSTAITAKLFVFLIDIFSKIHKSLSFSVCSRSKASACPASASVWRRHVRHGSASQSQYIYLQAKHSVLAAGCALRVSEAGYACCGCAARWYRSMPCCASCVLRRQSAHGCRSRSWNLYLQAIHNVLFSAMVIPPFSVCRTRTHSGMVSVYAAVLRM